MSRGTPLIRALSLVSALLLAGLVANALTVATILSDLPEYFPGDTVTLSGTGWTPGETVTIVLHRDSSLHPDDVLTSVANAGGTITNTSFTPLPDDLGVTFFVTATGSQSGLQATGIFKAKKRTWSGAVSTAWNTAGNWNPSGVPEDKDDVTIVSNVSSGRYPVVTSTSFADSVVIEAGPGLQPSITVSGGSLSVGNLKVEGGTLNVSGGTLLVTADIDVSSGATVNLSGTGVIHLANAIGNTPSDSINLIQGATFNQSGGTVNTLNFNNPGNTNSPGGIYNQSGGTLRVYNNFKNTGSVLATGGTIEFAGSGSSDDAFDAPGTNQFFNVVVATGVNTQFDSAVDAQIRVRGNWTMNGTAELIGRNTRVTFNGTGAQTIGGTAQTTFRNLFVDKTAGSTVVLARTALVTNGDVIVVNGTLDLATFTLSRSAPGGEIGVVGGAFLKIGGTNGFPANYAIHSFQPTSTVDYYGTNQTVTAETYGHLNLSTSGTKTMPATAMTTQGNFTMSGTASATAAQSLTVNGNFTLGSGTTFIAGASAFNHTVKGNFSNSGTFTASLGTFRFNGTGVQTIGGSSSTTFNSLNIDNPGGVVLSGVNTTVNGILTFTSGNVITGPSQFIATSATGNVSRTSGHVVGNFQKFVPTGATTLTYEIGDSGGYTPVTVSFGSVSAAGNLTGSTTPGDHPNASASPVDRLRSVNRYWTFTNSGLSFTNYTATFNFVAGDLDAGANTGAFLVGKLTGGVWTAPTVGARTSSSTQITGVTSFSDFQIGEGGQGTTLGNGVDPANTTVAPGGDATTAGAFTFQTEGSTDTVTAVTVTLAPGTFASLLQLQITDDTESIVYGSVNPLSDTPSIQLTTPITATTTSTQYKIRVRPESHALMPAPPGSNYALTARVSSWTSSNVSHLGGDSGGTIVTIDNLSPGNVSGATATSGNSQVTLAWTNPADSDLGTIVVLRRTGSAVSDTPAEGATYSVGNIIGSSTVACVVTSPATGCTDGGLTNGTVYHYKIFANDTTGNYAIGAAPTGSPVTPNVTTLGNGTEPPNATIAPGGAATPADAFTFQTSSGTDAITAITVTTAPGTRAGVSLIEITNDAGSIVYGSVSDPSSDTSSIPLTTPITATTTVTPYKIRITPKIHAAMPVPPGASYALTASVSSWTGTNAQAGSNSGGATITIDNLSPGDVTGATATGGNAQNTLAWTNPAASDLHSVVVLRRAGAPVATSPTEGVNYFDGDTIGSSIVACIATAPATTCIDEGLDNGTVYHYKVFARDANRNYATGIVPAGSPITPNATTLGDGTPVSDATVSPGGAATMADAFAFQTGTGTDSITAITVGLTAGTAAAVSVVEITDVAGAIVYGSISNPSGDTFTITLTTNIIATTTTTQYRVRVTPKSHAAMPAPPGTSYEVSVHIADWVGTNAHEGSDSGNTIITIDNLSPGNVTNANATAGSTLVVITGTKPGDLDLDSIVVLRRAGAAVTDLPVEGVAYSIGSTIGSSTVACVITTPTNCVDSGLTNGTAYHYKIFAKDTHGNYGTGVVPAGSPATPFAGIVVTPTSGLTTTEAGGTAAFTVVLTSRPVADVTIGLSSGDTTEGTLSSSSLVFTSLNWDIPQTVTVTGVNDDVDDGDIAYLIVTAPAVSAGGYNGVDASDVTVTNTDNDTAGITVSPTSGLSTTEDGGTATFTVVLNTQPTAGVTIGLSSSDTTEGTVSAASLTFTSANWNLPQTVTVTGVNDAGADGSVLYTILTAAATSGDGNYNGVDPNDVSVLNIDNNTVGIIVNPSSGLITTEAGGTATFSVVLNSQPTAGVTIGLSSSNTTEGTISASSLTFTAADWNIPQIVTITGVNDALDDGDIGYTIITSAATSTDPNYSVINPSDVFVTNIDDDTAGITVTPILGLTTTEAGGTATFTVVLNSQPTAPVTIGLSSSNTFEGTVSPASLTFTTANWNTPQTVTVTGVNDFRDDGDIAYTILTAPAVSGDGIYNTLDASNVFATNTDNDTAGITVTPTSGLTTTEAGGTATFTIVLNSQPTADVTIGLTSTNTTEGTVSAASVTFTSANWNAPQTVTVTGVDGATDDGDVAYSIITSEATSGDPHYDTFDPSNVSVTNMDDDTAGIIVTPTSGLITSEISGEAPTFTVVLTSRPTANVVINLSSSDTTEGTVSPVSLTFTSLNWNTPQTVTVHGVNDVIDDGDIAYTIVTAPAISGDPIYSGMNASDVSATNIDSDEAGFFVSPVSGLTTTEAGGRAHFTVVLNTQPLFDVTIALSSSNPSEGTVSPASLTFTPANWNIPQTVDVIGANDALDDGDIGYTVVTAAAVSADPGYNGLNPLDVTVLNIDNDTAGITVSPAFGLTTTESGGTATFTIVLNSQPTADVTIALSSSNPSEGTVSLTSVTFTTANWNTARTVTVTGVNDLIDDGDVIYSIVTAAATSGDIAYSGVNAADVSVSNTDDDAAGFTLTPASGLVTTEAGGAASFTVVLTAQPTANVTIGLISADTTEGTVSAGSLTFTTANWNVPQTITITGVNDFLVDGDITFDIVTTPASSSDSSYNGLSTGNVSVTNTDNDAAGIAVTPTFGLTTTEAGGTTTFTVVLTSQPAANVTIGLSSNDATEGTISLSSLTFTPANWNIPQTVTVTGVDDFGDDGDISYAILTAAATSADPNYNALDAGNVLVTNTDNDATGITVTPTAGLTTTEAGGIATYTIVLTSQPAADVTIALGSTDTTEGTISQSSLTFTPANWNIPQTVTVTGVNDAVDDGDIAYSISNAPATSADASYNGLDPLDVSVTNADGDTAGIIVTPISGLITTEAGGTTTFAVVLRSQPTADVTIGLSSDDTTEGTVSTSTLTFTSLNWNVAQTVTVTGVNDALDDGDIEYRIVTAAAISSDTNYGGFDTFDVRVTNTDDDTAGITVSPTSGLTTTEAGGTATFTVVLNAQPTADVTIGLTSSNTAEGTVAASITFTSLNWNTPQTVTVTGVNDALDDGDIGYNIVTAAATSSDLNYAGIDASDVSVTNADNDAAGIAVTPTSGLTTTEAGGTATFTVVLTSQPTADVSIGLSTSDATEGTVSSPNLTFTSANWNTPQTVTVTGVNDFLDDGDIAYSIVTTAATSADSNYAGLSAADVAVSNTDDDVAGITVTAATTPLTTTEAGGTATFTVVLNTQPTQDVTIALSSSTPAEGSVFPASLVFTSANWNVAQTVTVTGVDDLVVDGPITYTIVTAPAVSSDANYHTRNAADVLVTNSDNDVAGITVTATPTPLATSEAGGTATFTVKLNTQPTANVTIALTSSNLAEGTVAPASLVFTSANWNVAQTVTVTGADDLVVDGPITYTIVTAPAVSTDVNYNTRDAADVLVTNSDNDVAGITVTAATSPLTTTEAGGTATFTVRLNTQPTANVTIALSSSNPAEGTALPASLVFTSANWNVAQTVTVTGVDDAVVDGPITYTIVTAPAVSTDPNYNTRDATNVLVTNSDNDSAGITVTAATTPLTTTEAGGTATFTVVLNTQPTANVTIALSSSNPAEGTVLPASLVFTSANWNVAQTVTVTGADDAIVDGPITYTIVTAPAVSTDANYNTRNAADVLVTNSDNDLAGITVTAATTPLATSEAGGTATFSVVLNSQPTANVTIALSSSNPAEGTVFPASLVFTNANWATPQTVTVTGVDDAAVDGPITYTIVTAPAVSTDASYNTRDAADVLVTNSDNDSAGITVTAATTPLTTTEAGGTASFTVVLNTQPTQDVTIALSSSNPAEGTVLPASLVFTSANWNVAQTVTVTGADDAIVDGPITYTIVTAPAVSTDPNYGGRDAADVLVTNSDNDIAGITVTAATTPLATTEAGGTATFTIVLTSQPTANVTIAVSSSTPAEGTVAPTSLVFTPGNWNVAQTVTVTGVDDAVADGPITYTIATAPAVSTDANYNTRDAADVLVTNSDNDVAGITVTAATTPLATTEAGGTATFTVVLNTQPTANVTIALSSSNPAEGAVAPTSLIFTPGNWNVAQTVTVTGTDDTVADGPITYTIVTAPAVSTDANYNTRDAADVLVTNSDNDNAGITVTPTSGLTTTEAGGTATFTVVLTSRPTANVTIALSSSKPAEGGLSAASLVFTSANWNVAQTVTVTGVDDQVVDGPQAYAVLTAPAVSADANYSTRNPADVLVTNADNDVAGITVTPTTPLTTTEAGGTATFTVVLNSQPTDTVTIAVSSNNTAEGTVAPASLVFTSANWNVAQTVTVTGADDLVVDGPITYTIVTAPAVSTDVNYNTRDAADVLVTNSDNDVAGITVTAATSPLTTTEAGGTATFTVRLNTQPTANVTIALSSSNPAEGTALPASLVFTSANWNVAQTVTVTGVDDAVVDGPITYTIVTAPAVSTDPNYNTRDATNVLVTNSDNDSAGITVTAATTPLTTTEAGGTATFTVVLNTQPTANVTIALSSSNPAEGTVLPASLVFTSANWNVAQTVTVTGADDAIVDGPITYTIVTAPAVSTDANYNTRNAADVLVTNSDNDLAGITVTAATTPLATSEAGGTATFSVVLNSQPTANVTIALSSSNPAEGTVFPASLVFTNANWATPQTVTVTGVDDAAVDGPITYTIVTAPAVSTDASYNTRDAADVLVTNSDNDSAGITVTAATTPLTTTEAGGTASFTVVLNTQPTQDVTIALSSSNPAEGTVLPASLVFTSANWNVAQTVTVTGADDAIVDGPITYTIVTAPAVSTDPNYGGRDAADVLVTNSDNDIAGITVTAATTPLATTEAGGTATFTIVLTSQPTANVTIAVSSSTPAEGTVAPTSLVFTPGNWNVAQTVTVTGVDDAVADGPITYTIATAPAVSTDANYNTRDAADVLVTNSDNDVAGITVTAATTPLATTEAGGTATFTVVLNTQPTANVTIALSSSNPAEGAVAPTSLIFTPGNWNVAQTVTVTGTDDTVADGPITYTIVTAAAVSTDANYNTRDAADVLVTNSDNDNAGITVTAATIPLATTEAGGTATFTVVLNTQPTANVTIALSSSNPAEGTVLPASLVFTSANWNVAQTVTVTGADDTVVDGPITYTIVTAPAVSADANYNTRNAADILVTNGDNDVAGITVTPTSGLTTTEAGGTATFTVVLNSQPTANVAFALSSSNPAEGTVFPTILVFTSANWNLAQTVTVTGVDDAVVDGPITYTIVTAPAVSTDASYNTRNAADVLVTNIDNDVAGITVTPTSGLTTTEAGGTATFTVVLTSQPAANVTIALSSSIPAEGTVSPTSLAFTTANWNVARIVTVTGVDDSAVDGNIAYTIVTAAAVSADTNYAGVNASDVTVTNSDNDIAGITVTPTSGLTTTEAGGTATFTVVLNTQPTASVTIALSSSIPAEGTVSPASLTFTTANWNVAQTVTVTGLDDSAVDGSVAYTIVTAAAVSTDSNYNALNAADVAVTNTDNDVAGITVTPTSGLTTTEAGGTATFTVVLNTQPTASVTIALSSSIPAEGTASPASLTFTTANWNVAQTVTVTGENDAVVDGNIAYTIVTAAAVSADTNYQGVNAADVTVTNTDNDVAGITVSSTSGLTTTEAGGTATLTVVLNTQPSANVTIALSSSNPLEGTVSPTSLTFTTANWNVAQSVTVTGVDDSAVDGNILYTIVTAAATSTDTNYSGLNAADVTVTNSDNDIAGVTVTPTSGLTTTEAGGTATFTVVLNTQPSANVTIGLSSSNPLEGTVSPTSLIFTTANWNVAQTVTVTGMDDAVVDGSIGYTIVTAAAASADTNYQGVNAADVTVANTDNDVAGITVTPTSGLTTTEALGTATFTVVLNTQPTADVTIGLTSSNTAEGTVSPASLIFTSANWNVAQTVTVTGVNDAVVDGNVAYTIVTAAATSTDTNFAGVNASDVAVTNTDDDVFADLGVTTTNGVTGVTAGSSVTYTVVVSNGGPGGVVGATVTDSAPANVTFGSWTCVASPGSTCPASGTGNIAVAVSLLAGGTATFTVPATISATASGIVIHTATVVTAAGAVDPTPANNVAVDTDAVSTITDLSVTMTNGTNSVTSAGPTTYVIVVTNAGANAAGGAVITDVGSGVAMTALTCTAAGGAVCPTTPSVAQLQAGLVIPTLPAGGSVTFTLVTIVTAASGTVTNTATVTAPAGVVDTTPANNSATDSDAVVAAPAVADLAVVITDNMTVLVPGTGTVYAIIVTNQGPSAVAGVTVTNTAPAGLTFGNWTCVASAGSSCDTGGTGSISTIVNLLAGGTAVFSVPATLTPGAPASIANTVVATVPAGVIDPAPANNTATDVNQAVLPQIMGIGIRAGTMTAVGPAAFEVPFTVDVSNIGVNPLTNLQVADSLSSAFVLGTPTITIVGPPTVSGPAAGNGQVVAAASTVCVANSGFTGIGAAFDPGTQLLSGALPIDPGQGCTIDFRVRLTYASISAIPTEPQFNTAVARTSSGAGGAAIASAASSTAIELQLPRVDVTKMLTSVEQLGNEPVFDVSYAIVMKNTSQAAAANVQVTDDLAATFAPGAPVISVVSGPTIESGNASITLANGVNAFNGTTRTAMLIGTDTMLPGTESRIGFTVRVSYPSGAAIPIGIDLNNSAIATTNATPGGTVITQDVSTDVTDSAAPPRADDVPDPTTVRLVPHTQLTVQKLANVLVAEIGDTVQYAIRVRNISGPALPAVSLTDQLPLGFRYVAGSARLGAAGAAQPLPDPAGGVGPVLTFAIPAQAESAEALITYRVRVGVGALQGDGVNRAEAVSGDVLSNTAAARVLVSGGVFTTDACVIGAIFVDLNGNGLQDVGEPGVPDVALHFEEGTSLVTDLQGKYSYCGLTPTTHVLRVDGTTLPAGATLTTNSNRNAGNASSLFVDLKFGEVHRADFIVEGNASQAVIDEIGVRRARAEVWAPKFDEPARAGVSGGRPVTGTGALAGVGVTSGATSLPQNQTAGGFEPIRQAGGLNSANSNAPEPLPAAIDPPAVNSVVAPNALPPSTTLRQMLLVGLLDGAVSFSKVDGGLLAPARPEAVFDREFRRFTGSFDNGQGQYGGRGAVFVKGTVASHYLMTFAYDSDKDVRSALFRDIQPEAFYPIYGDGSEKRFDAQTSGRFYARVDRGHSYLMYGDLQTSSFSPEAQALGAYNRALTGVQQHFENSRMVVNLFASHDSLRQVIDEYAARGISGPYPVSNPNGVSGTERVEIITRDRNQPALVLSAVRLTRFTDYEFEPFSGRLLFRMPVPSLDERLNPVSIRVTYEVDAGGDKSWVGGGNVQMRFGKSLQIGGSWIEDGTPGSPYRLLSANTTLRLGGSSTIVIEAAQSTGTVNTGIGGAVPATAADVDTEGLAARIEWRYTSSQLIARAFGAFSDPGFNNPASTLAGGRSEAGGRARWTITKGVSFIGEAIHSEDRVTGGRRDGGLLTLETKWRPLVFEVGMRRATETGAPSQGTGAGIPLFGSSSASGFGFGSTDNRIDPVTGQPIVQPGFGPRLSAGPNAAPVESPDVMTVRTKLTFLLGKRADFYGEFEQDVRSADRRVAAVGAQLKFSDKVKLYARHEFISSLDGPYALTDGQRSYNTVVGLASTYMKDGDLFSEYRLGDAISGREAEAAMGLRNHWTLAKGVRLSTGFERVQSIAGATREATAVSAGLEYTTSARLKGTGRIEWRQDSSSDSWLSTVGIAQRLSRDWTMLARNYYQVTVPEGLPNLVQDRVSIGAAYRDTAKNRVNLLTRYEFRLENTADLTIGAATDRRLQIVSTHVDVHPLRAWTFSGQHALKFVDDRTELSTGRFGTQLVSGRVGFDISKRWDIGALTSVMWGGEGGRRSALGGEVGFQIRQGLWLSGGYNVTGFTDRDLVSSNFTTRGAFMRIRVKFDESIVPGSAKGGR